MTGPFNEVTDRTAKLEAMQAQEASTLYNEAQARFHTILGLTGRGPAAGPRIGGARVACAAQVDRGSAR
ncbi:MAG: hypothetical protein WDN30_03875 [Pararobbsia sp.]